MTIRAVTTTTFVHPLPRRRRTCLIIFTPTTDNEPMSSLLGAELVVR